MASHQSSAWVAGAVLALGCASGRELDPDAVAVRDASRADVAIGNSDASRDASRDDVLALDDAWSTDDAPEFDGGALDGAPLDGGWDAGSADARSDDARSDDANLGGDTGRDAGSPDAGQDAGRDAGQDAGQDAGRDAGPACVDTDGDGFFVGAGCSPVDCNDLDGSIRPTAVEVCDNRDQNCNGSVDEGLPTLTCGVGFCQRTVPSCVGGAPQTCSPGLPRVETCNAVDDDCNALVDDGLGTLTCGVGACRRVVNSCAGGVPQSCTPGAPSSETCNGVDDNCNGSVDDGLAPLSCGLGLCARTVSACVSGVPQMCTPGTPVAEVCGNGLDENCNGTADDGCSVAGDLCTSPIALDLSAASLTITGTTVGAASNTSAACCSGGPDLFYGFTLTRTEYVYASTLGRLSWDSSLYLLDTSCNPIARSAPEVACSDDSCGTVQSQIMAVLPAGSYRLAVDGCGSSSGAFTVDFAHYPVGIEGDGGILSAGTNTRTGTITSGSGVSPSGCGGSGRERSYWWTTCHTQAAGTLTAATCGGATWDTYLGVHHSNAGSGCDDDGCSAQSTVTQSLPAGAGMHVLYMDAFGSSSGAYTLSVTRP